MRDFPPGFATKTPQRRPNSVRRTTSVELSWPGAFSGVLEINGWGRDLRTGEAPDQPEVIHEDRFTLSLAPDRFVESCTFDPPLLELSDLQGVSVRKGWRQHIEPIVQQEALSARPIPVLLDDLVGCCTIENWTKVNWGNLGSEENPFDRSAFENVCIAYATGSPTLSPLSEQTEPVFVPALTGGADAFAFHPLSPDEDRTMRRVRRIDIWHEDGAVRVDAMFQDSGVTRGARRAALHEYRLLARLAPGSEGRHEITQIDTAPGILPYNECLGAKQNVTRLIGWKLDELRAGVHRELKGPQGCTHLNDALRSLAGIDALVHHLPPESPHLTASEILRS